MFDLLRLNGKPVILNYLESRGILCAGIISLQKPTPVEVVFVIRTVPF
jgi:hypothetical protein